MTPRYPESPMCLESGATMVKQEFLVEGFGGH